MKILICGAGRTTDELLKRFSDQWQVTLVDKQEKKLEPYSRRFTCVQRVIAEDASSLLVLSDAGIEDHNYVLALTDDDRVNLTIATEAREKKVHNIMARVHDPQMQSQFSEMGVWTVLETTIIARRIYQHLQNPKIKVVPFGQGESELVDIEIDDADLIGARDLMRTKDRKWRPVGVVRNHELIYPDNNLQLEVGDRLLVLGPADLFNDISSLIATDQPHFPLTYGQVLVVGLAAGDGQDTADLIKETLYIAQNTKIHRIKALCRQDRCFLKDDLNRWSESLDMELLEAEESVFAGLPDLARKSKAGLVVVPPTGISPLKSMAKPVMIERAHDLPCPLLVARSSSPYEKILVPFSGSASSRNALRVAIDLAEQMAASITALVVVEAEFLHGKESGNASWQRRRSEMIQEIAHQHKFKVKEALREGNPVREVLALAKEFDLMVIGAGNPEKELFNPHIGDLLARKSPLSVLIVTEKKAP